MLVGVIGVGTGLALLGNGMESTRRAMAMFAMGQIPLGALTMLLGGAVLGLLAGLARRMPAAPVTAGAVLLAAGALSMVAPGEIYSLLGPGGIGDVILLQMGTAFGALLVVAVLVARRQTSATPSAPESGGPRPSSGSGPVVH